jgi:hypothetical protein
LARRLVPGSELGLALGAPLSARLSRLQAALPATLALFGERC